MSKKVLFVVAPRDFKDDEYFIPKQILEDSGIEVTTASLEEKARSVDGEEIDADIGLFDAGSDWDAVVFVGGPGATIYFDKEEAHDLVREMNRDGKVIAAICIAPSVLANAGLLEGKKATAFPTQETNLKNHRAAYTGNGLEVSGNIITAKGPDYARQFGKAILEALD